MKSKPFFSCFILLVLILPVKLDKHKHEKNEKREEHKHEEHKHEEHKHEEHKHERHESSEHGPFHGQHEQKKEQIQRRMRARYEDIIKDPFFKVQDDPSDDNSDEAEWLYDLQESYGQCKPNPCLNNGVCEVKGKRRFKCDCPKTFRGRICERGIRRCNRGSCGHGECVLISKAPFFECKCKLPFVGPQCEKPAVCQPNPCKNGGKCIKDDMNFNCDCPNGFSGRFCNVGPDDCYKTEDQGESYRGKVSETDGGDECLFWNSHFTLQKGTDPFNNLDDDDGLGPHNSCRNPDGDKMPWCFIRRGLTVLWDFCDVRKCVKPTDSPPKPPAGPDPKPVPTPSKPVIPPVKPVPTPSKPVIPPFKPIPTPAKPVIPPFKPVPTPSKPVIPPFKPVPTPSKPVIPPFKPVPTPSKPVIPPVKPVPTPSKPVIPPVKPVPTPSKPVIPPVKPVPTPDKPVPTPDKPVPTPAKPTAILHSDNQFTTCGKTQPKKAITRIYGGLKAIPGAQPWQLSLQVRPKGTTRSYGHICGAVLISSCWALTAGHCIDPKSQMQVVGGSLTLGKDEASKQTIDVEKAIRHENYRESSDAVYNDIAVLKLKGVDGRCAVESQFLRTACLPGDPFPDGSECTISGWGATENSSYGSRNLLDAQVMLINQESCSDVDVYGKLLDSSMFCAGFLQGGVDSCQGDSGGPLTCDKQGTHVIYGIVSWGDQCGRANKPGVYARVSHFTDWIKSKIQAG
ncbi:hypothetical protein DPEC_G00036680 [Dallia pectoralis]|uniref:Uncharacterized protein n=1 Tax=Dallia pectoralis TaxID=75939 RepID=A0ACC2HDL9_DALPE|nr:hypothetical protein DPEC_G00036680 [Dallia pectoralis]